MSLEPWLFCRPLTLEEALAETITSIELADTARTRYLRYAMSVITSRALPDARDGLKPVQRRILYAMEHDLYLRPTARFMKSARVVGDTMGKYHPHSGQAIYDAMVRMAQAHSLRYPLVDGQGNFGAVTGDSAAAQRYTETKLRSLGSELMETLPEQTVPTRLNYDETLQEPVVLPTPVPLLLLNGSTGIAVGMATNIPPHNFKEVLKAAVTLIDKPDASVAALLRSIKGPDFPTGGELVSTQADLRKIYETGTGTIKVQGTYREETGKEDKQRVERRYIVIDSVPYGVSTGQILGKIKELVDSKKIPQVTHVSDQTTEAEGVRLVMELRTGETTNADLIMAAVYRLTPARISYGINLTCLLPSDRGVLVPRRHVDLKTLLRCWLDFRYDVVTRSIEFRKKKLEERIHILEGLKKVLGSVSDAIKLIRASKDKADARVKLCKKYKLSEIQANAVLEIQLYRLAQLEVKKIKDELAVKSKERNRLAKLLKGKKPRWNLIKKELTDLSKRHGDKRRTTLLLGEGAALDYDPTALIKKEDAHVVLSVLGRIKRQRTLDDLEKVRLREDDGLFTVLQGSTLANAVFFTNFGSAYVLPINDVPPTTGFGEPIQKFFSFKDGEKVISAFSLDERLYEPLKEPVLLVGVSSGSVVRVPLTPHLDVSTKSGRKFVRLGKGDVVVGAEIPTAADKSVLMATSKGNVLRVRLKDVVAIAGVGKGKRGIKLAKGEKLAAISLLAKVDLDTTRGGVHRIQAKKLALGEFGGEGIEILTRFGFKGPHLLEPTLYELPELE